MMKTKRSRAIRRNYLVQEERALSPQGEDFLKELFECPHGVPTCNDCIGSCVHKCDGCMVEDMARREGTRADDDPFDGLNNDTRVTADPDRRGYRR